MRYTKKTFILFILGLWNVIYIQAQSNFQSTSIGPSPEVVAGTSTLHSPANLYTGVPQIGIPLYRLQVGSLTVPVSLSYRADGIKVTDISSWVGTGWHLQAGGAVTRVVRGRPDESEYGFWHYASMDISDNKDAQYATTMDAIFDANDPNVPITWNEANLPSWGANRFTNGCYDTEPDLFTVQAPGLSATFLIDRTKDVHILSQNSLKIEMDGANGSLEQWKVSTPNGRLYVFGKGQVKQVGGIAPLEVQAMDKTTIQTSCTNTGVVNGSGCGFNSYVGTWHLVQIISASRQDTIYYDYQDIETHYMTTSHTEYTIVSSDDYEKTLNDEIPKRECEQYIHIDGKLLSRIRSSMGHHLEFITSNDPRLDWQDRQGMVNLGSGQLYYKYFHNGKTLESIHSYFRGKKIKTFRFRQSYFLATEHFSSHTKNKPNRLRLDGIEEYNHQDQTIAPYVFEYEGNRTARRGMYGYDRWGYYNGNMDESSLVSEVHIREDGDYYVHLPHREPNPELMQQGILKKIIYPSGASRSFEYEPQTYFTEQGVVQNGAEKTINLSIPSQQIATFEIPSWGGYTQATIKVKGIPGCNSMKLFTPADAHFDITPEIPGDPETGTPSTPAVWTPLNPGQDFVVNPNAWTILSNLDRDMVYTIHNGCTEEIEIIITWVEPDGSVTSTPENKLGGGLRIKSVTIQDDTDPLQAKVVNYLYTEKDPLTGEERSSGRMKNFYSYYHRINVQSNTNAILAVVGTNNFTPMANSMGSRVGYNQVTVIEGDISGQSRGKVVYKFSNIAQSTNGKSLKFPFVPVGLSDRLYGLPQEIISYRWDEIASDFKITQKVLQEYNATTTPVHHIWGVKIMKSSDILHHNTYAHEARRIQLLKTETQVYDTQGQVLTNVVNRVYEPSHGFLRSTTTTNSKGEVRERRTTYAFEVDANTYSSPMKEAILLMQDRYMLNLPLLVEDRLVRNNDWELLGRSETLFEIQSQVNNSLSTSTNQYIQYSEKILPKIQYALETESPIPSTQAGTVSLTPLVSYETYDGLGHILSSRGVDKNTGSTIDKLGLPTSQIWSDLDSYQSAEVVNADANQIAYTSFEHLPRSVDEEPYSHYIKGLTPQNTHLVTSPKEGNWEFEDYEVFQDKLHIDLDISNSPPPLGTTLPSFSIDYPQEVLLDLYIFRFDPSNVADIEAAYQDIYESYEKQESYLYIRKQGTDENILESYHIHMGTYQKEIPLFLDAGTYEISFRYDGDFYYPAPIDTVQHTVLEGDLDIFFQKRQNNTHYQRQQGGKTGLYSGNALLSKSNLPADTYTLSLWSKGAGNINIGYNGTLYDSRSMTPPISDDWTYQQWEITASEGTKITINPGSNIQLDEVRLFPKKARMNTYNYEPLRKQIHTVTDANNHCLYYEYDDWGRLLLIRDEDGNIVEHYKYQSKYEK